jgi:tRNA A37 threonylcarbamoyltransferase TsaD
MRLKHLDIAGGVAESQRLRDNIEDAGEQSTILRKLEYGEFCDIEKGQENGYTS